MAFCWLDAAVLGVVFAGVFTQGLVGFGSAMLTMPLLPGWIGLPLAAPLVALIAVPTEVIGLFRYRQSLSLRAVSRLVIGMLVGVPLGLMALRYVAPGLLLRVLGALIVGYATYALFEWRLPALHAPGWGYLFGWIAGVIGGAYNTSGPPMVIYGTCRRWPPAEFKGNLQAFFLVADLFVSVAHAAAGNVTLAVCRYFLLSLPVVVVGVLAGMALDRFVNPRLFRRLVLSLLLVLGLRLLV
jgi:uncharacterized membrane protein YfcA